MEKEEIRKEFPWFGMWSGTAVPSEKHNYRERRRADRVKEKNTISPYRKKGGGEEPYNQGGQEFVGKGFILTQGLLGKNREGGRGRSGKVVRGEGIFLTADRHAQPKKQGKKKLGAASLERVMGHRNRRRGRY